MFKQIVRANKNRQDSLRVAAQNKAEESDWTFTGLIEPNPYSAEFTDGTSKWYGWAIESDEGEIDFAFGSGQMIFNGEYTLTDEDYYETIGAGE